MGLLTIQVWLGEREAEARFFAAQQQLGGPGVVKVTPAQVRV